MRGYFGIGVEGVSKPGNLGNLFRSAHAFGASFLFTVAEERRVTLWSDTSESERNLPFYRFSGVAEMRLPAGCDLVGVELIDDATDLPAFRHPHAAAYVLGPEKGSLSPELVGRCDHLVRIPTAFCVNLAVAGAIVMYDRLRMLGRFVRPVTSHGGAERPPGHVHGGRFRRRRDGEEAAGS